MFGFGAVAEAALEDLGAGREDKDGDSLGELLHDLHGALDVDVEQEVLCAAWAWSRAERAVP